MLSAFVIYPQAEYKSNIRKLLNLTGVKSYSYWLHCFVFDYIIYSIYVLIVIAIFTLYGLGLVNTFSGPNELGNYYYYY